MRDRLPKFGIQKMAAAVPVILKKCTIINFALTLMDFQIILMLKERRYLLLSFFFSILILILYPLFQILPLILQNPDNFWFGLKQWFSLLTPLKLFLYFLYGILFGLTISFFIWQKRKRICLRSTMIKSGFLGSFGATSGAVLPFCPACFSLAGFLLPLSTLSLLIKYTNLIMIGSVALLFLSLWLLGAFQKR